MDKNNDLKNEIKIVQVNPNLRLLLLIFCNWFWLTLFPLVTWGFFQISVILNDFPYLIWIGCGFFLFLSIFIYLFDFTMGIRYLPKNLREHYVQKNNNYLKKNKNVEIDNVTQFFNVIPICNETYSENKKTKKKEFIGLSCIEICKNRLVVNGKINNLDFSWGIVTKMKKNNFKVFLLSVLCFGPLFGITIWLLTPNIFSTDLSKQSYEAEKLGCFDLFVSNVEKINSENYLIFSAKLKNEIPLTTLIPKNNDSNFENLDSLYEWPVNLSEIQKKQLQSLIKEMSFLPSIYLDQNQISIIMKKYFYNDKDNDELQNWELIRDEKSKSEIQFNYLNNAIKIYQIFDSSN